MGEIHAFQPALTSDGARRLIGDLRAMVDAGLDPGPRTPQIRGGGEQLEMMVTRLRELLADHSLSAELANLIDKLERLANLARSYKSDCA